MDGMQDLNLHANTTAIMFADDILLVAPTTSADQLCRLQDDIDKVTEFIATRGLQLNAKKTQHLVIRLIAGSAVPQLTVEGKPVTATIRRRVQAAAMMALHHRHQHYIPSMHTTGYNVRVDSDVPAASRPTSSTRPRRPMGCTRRHQQLRAWHGCRARQQTRLGDHG